MHHNQDLQNRLKILAFQPQIPITYTKEARQAHVDRMIATLEKSIAQQGAVDVVVLPELATIDYSRQAFDQLPDLAEKSEGDSFERLSTFAQHVGCTVVYGFARKEKGDYFISQNVINPAGRLVAGYDKLHAAHFGFSMEKDYFSTGQRLAVFQVGGFRFGIVICYDFRFPELTRLYAEQYAVDIMLHPVAFSRDDSFPSWHHFVITRALENHTYFLSLNRAGEFWGNSIFCPPWSGDHLSATTFGVDEEIRVFTVDRLILDEARATYPFSQDKLSDYSQLQVNGLPEGFEKAKVL